MNETIVQRIDFPLSTHVYITIASNLMCINDYLGFFLIAMFCVRERERVGKNSNSMYTITGPENHLIYLALKKNIGTNNYESKITKTTDLNRQINIYLVIITLNIRLMS